MAKLSTAVRVLAQSSVKEALPIALEEARIAYEAGDRSVLMEVLYECALFQAIVPDWAVDAFIELRRGMAEGRIRDWNEALGKPAEQVNTRALNRKLEKHRGSVLAVLTQLRIESVALNQAGAFSEAATRLQATGIPVNSDHVEAIYKAHGNFLHSIPQGGDGAVHGVLDIQIPMSELRRRGRPLWED